MELQLRKDLSTPGLLNLVREGFLDVPDHRSELSSISLTDILMSGLAVFHLKYSSLLQFDQHHHNEEIVRHNLKTLYGIKEAPCDTQMRKVLDGVDPRHIRPAFKSIFSCIQRGKALEPFKFIDGHYLISIDGSDHLSSTKIHCDECCERKDQEGNITYFHQLVGAVIVHPDLKVVIPLCPEPITKKDGATKNDCESNASKRLLEDLRREHPHLKIIILQDSLASNGPHIKLLKLLSMHFILGAKPGDHKSLFEQVEKYDQDGLVEKLDIIDEDGTIHRFRFINGVSLNKEHSDILVNFLEYWEISSKGTKHFSWVTDFLLDKDNVFIIMKGGRSRWKVENETFNTLKNQGYNCEHNYGHGNKNLTTIFLMLMMLSFLIDQTVESSCKQFQQARKVLVSRKNLWERLRALFVTFFIQRWEELIFVLITGPPHYELVPKTAQGP